MKPHYIILLVVGLLLSVVSCRKQTSLSSLFDNLVQIESIMEQYPDSAFQMLQQIQDASSYPISDQAYYYLLLTEAQDKNYQTPVSDSLLLIALDYYQQQEEDPYHLTKAWYYKGRIHHEAGDPLRAQTCYLKALDAGIRLDQWRLLGRINNLIGWLYTYQRVYEQAIPYLHAAIMYAKKANSSRGMAFSSRDLGRVYSVMEKPDSAIFYYKQSISLAELNSSHSELASIYLKQGYDSLALKHLSRALELSVLDEDRFPLYLVLGEYYTSNNQTDSALYYLKKSIESPTLATQAASCYFLTEIAKLQNDKDAYIHWNEKYVALSDSINRQKVDNELRITKKQYEDRQIAMQMEQKELEVSLVNYRWALVCLLLLFVILFIGIERKRRGEKLEEQRRRFELLDHQLQLNKRLVVEKEQLIDRLQKQNAQYSTRSIISSDGELPLQKSNQTQEEFIRSFSESNVYQRFHSEQSWKPSSDDWNELQEMLNQYYDNFTVRLKQLVPAISENELRVVCLLKAEVRPLVISQLLCCSISNVSKLRSRLYKKITGVEGSSIELDRLISDL